MFPPHGSGFEQYWRHRPDVVRWMKQANESALATVKRAPLATVVARWLKDFVEERTSASVGGTPPGVGFREFGGAWAADPPLLWRGGPRACRVRLPRLFGVREHESVRRRPHDDGRGDGVRGARGRARQPGRAGKSRGLQYLH